MPEHARILNAFGIVEASAFNDIISATVGCAVVPTFNSYVAKLHQMEIAPNDIAQDAFGQHARMIVTSPITYNAIH